MLDEKYNFKNVNTDRVSGILMHISSLPSPYGIGTIGKSARDFADFLDNAGQTYWQMLPVGPTGYGDSPYQSFSTFAGNPYLIDLDTLKDQELINMEELLPLNENLDIEKVDFGILFNERFKVLRFAYERFDGSSSEFQNFCKENSFWLNDYALYMSIKEKQEGKSWVNWEDKYKFRDEEALKEFEKENFVDVNFYRFIQYIFFTQWEELKNYIHGKGIKTIGDLPIYVAEDSADTWANPHLFQLNDDRTPQFVGGCPPDAFSDDGQLWGNPCYDWEANEKESFKWWIERIRWAFSIFDSIRIDHFRGFESYWKIPFGDKNAKRGNWEQGPAIKLFNAVKKELGDLPIIAEDLGYMTKEVYEFREATGFPGMKILQFAFNPSADSDYLPHNITQNYVIYTGTHDNDTVVGWLNAASYEEIDLARRYLNLTHEEGYNWGLMRGAMTSVANMAIFQMQDLLGLDNSKKMNSPGTLGSNWSWRMRPDAITPEITARFRELTRISGRLKK
ncbi:MAG: 4-alpha-glucanotransferase [Tissierellia bacterium]|nr:4-alpha-glucanotransferase [Tissierellia bacterium]